MTKLNLLYHKNGKGAITVMLFKLKRQNASCPQRNPVTPKNRARKKVSEFPRNDNHVIFLSFVWAKMINSFKPGAPFMGHRQTA